MEINQTYSYINEQTMRVAPFPIAPNSRNGAVKIQLRSVHGKTDWIEITPEQHKQIERILCGVDLVLAPHLTPSSVEDVQNG